MLLGCPLKQPALGIVTGPRSSSAVPLIHPHVLPEAVLLLGCSQPVTEHCMGTGSFFSECKSPCMGTLAEGFHIGLAETFLELHGNLRFLFPFHLPSSPYMVVRHALQLYPESSSWLLVSSLACLSLAFPHGLSCMSNPFKTSVF